jgi:hypothetical protein
VNSGIYRYGVCTNGVAGSLISFCAASRCGLRKDGSAQGGQNYHRDAATPQLPQQKTHHYVIILTEVEASERHSGKKSLRQSEH